MPGHSHDLVQDHWDMYIWHPNVPCFSELLEQGHVCSCFYFMGRIGIIGIPKRFPLLQFAWFHRFCWKEVGQGGIYQFKGGENIIKYFCRTEWKYFSLLQLRVLLSFRKSIDKFLDSFASFDFTLVSWWQRVDSIAYLQSETETRRQKRTLIVRWAG